MFSAAKLIPPFFATSLAMTMCVADAFKLQVYGECGYYSIKDTKSTTGILNTSGKSSHWYSDYGDYCFLVSKNDGSAYTYCGDHSTKCSTIGFNGFCIYNSNGHC